MKREKRKSWVILELAKANDKKQWKSNWIYMMTLAFTIVLLASVCTIVKGKIDTDQLIDIRKSGTTANAFLLNATKEQYRKAKSLQFVQHVGIERSFAGVSDEKNQMILTCAVLDMTGYKRMLKPSCADIVGKYPQKETEIFMSKNALSVLGIDNPKLGMKISLDLNWFDWMTNENHRKIDNKATYTLSGYYNDYIEKGMEQTLPVLYFSNEFLKDHDETFFPAKLWIMTKYSFLDSSILEELLVQNIKVHEKKQQIIVEKSSYLQALENFTGGFEVALFAILLLGSCVFFVIYNFVMISLNQNIRQFGLLETIGMTRKQMQTMLFLQNLKKSVLGCLIGGLLSIIVNRYFLRVILEKLYLNGIGSGMKLHTFSLLILGFSILFVFFISMFSSMSAFYDLKKLPSLEAKNYYKKTLKKKLRKNQMDLDKIGRKERSKKSKYKSIVAHMAWQNLRREKKKVCIAFLTLWIGCEVILLFHVLEIGMDPMHKLKQNYDFEIGICDASVNAYLDSVKFENVSQKRLFTDKNINEIMHLTGVKKENLKISQGGYGFIDTDALDAFAPRKESLEEAKNYNNFVTVQILQEDALEKLKSYCSGRKVDTRISSVIKGDSAILLHKNELSMQQKEEANRTIAEKFTLYPTYVSMAEKTKAKTTGCGGYLDTTQKAFPNLDLTFYGNGVNYLIVNEEGFQNLGLKKQIFHISFSVPQKKEAFLKKQLNDWVIQQNSNSTLQFYFVANSDKIAIAKDYIEASRLIMQVIGAFLFLMGILHYLNVRSAELFLRKEEFVLLERIGMTKKQLQKMIFCEGIYFCLILFASLISLGSIGLWVFAKILQQNVLFFSFSYPILPFIFIIIIFTIVSAVLPQLFFIHLTDET